MGSCHLASSGDSASSVSSLKNESLCRMFSFFLETAKVTALGVARMPMLSSTHRSITKGTRAVLGVVPGPLTLSLVFQVFPPAPPRPPTKKQKHKTNKNKQNKTPKLWVAQYSFEINKWIKLKELSFCWPSQSQLCYLQLRALSDTPFRNPFCAL